MAITLTNSPQIIGQASDSGFQARMMGWYTGQSGNTAIVHVELQILYYADAYYYGTNKNYTLNFNGTSSGQYTPQMNNGVWYSVAERTQTLSGGANISASGSWYSYVYGSFSIELMDTVSLPAFIIAPTTPTLTITNNNAHQNTISFGTSSFGNPSTGNIKLYVATNPSFTSETLLQTKTTTGLFTYTHTSLTANTTYYYRTIATNGSASSPYVSGNITTRRATYVADENDKSILTQSLLVSHNGLSKYVLKLYRGDSNNEAERIY